ncbi:MAG TPA: hypothetical protein VJR47_04390 [Stellaceae bacterium]|nr:hypothetical protein [Stellaceae bacterium]
MIDRDEVGKALQTIAAADRKRSHATFFNASSEFQGAMEVAFVAEWAKVVNERYGWNVRGVRKNANTYPDCLADYGPSGTKIPAVIGIEVTELVDGDAIKAHQELRWLKKIGKFSTLPKADKLALLERMSPEWPLEKFTSRLTDRVREKNLRSRDRALAKQFLLVLTDEGDLDERTLETYVKSILLPQMSNFDAIYIMTSYVPRADNDGYYPVFELPTGV